jgi:hypothetical protein
MSRIAVPTLLAGALALSAPLAAAAEQAQQMTCIKRVQLIQHLANQFKEKPIAAGLTENGWLLEVYASREGETWTIAMTMPNGTTCLVASGQEWQALPQKAELGPPA